MVGPCGRNNDDTTAHAAHALAQLGIDASDHPRVHAADLDVEIAANRDTERRHHVTVRHLGDHLGLGAWQLSGDPPAQPGQVPWQTLCHPRQADGLVSPYSCDEALQRVTGIEAGIVVDKDQNLPARLLGAHVSGVTAWLLPRHDNDLQTGHALILQGLDKSRYVATT